VLELTEEQHRVVRFYTALFCVNFMGEFGQRFNQGVQPLDLERLGRLERILNDDLCEAE
jgi:hypothetical protein